MGGVVHRAKRLGASCPWDVMSVGRVVHRASCPWGELSMGRNDCGAKCHGASFDGASCPGILYTVQLAGPCGEFQPG
jgi:hypothetical protein